VAVAAHTTLLGWLPLRFEAVGWATEILDAATSADVRQLPRLYTAASLCSQIGEPEAAVGYARTAVALAADSRYDPFEPAWTRDWEAGAYLYAGQMEESFRIGAELVGQPGAANVLGLSVMLLMLPLVGRADEARALADEAVKVSQAHGNPWLIASMLVGYGRAFADTDPTKALDVLREGVEYSRKHRLVAWEAVVCREAGGLEAVHGDPGQALALLANAIDLLHRAGDVGNLAVAFADLAVLFDHLLQPEIAATLYGAGRRYGTVDWVTHLGAAIDHVRTVLGDITFDHCADTGAAMDISDAVTYARQQIRLADRH
jgi:hypothetical protein